MRQILYSSSHTNSGNEAELDRIFVQSTNNNALDGITGLLASSGGRFIQIIEGSKISVGPCFERILADKRHHSINVIIDQRISIRHFEEWTMLRSDFEGNDVSNAFFARITAKAGDLIKSSFNDFFAKKGSSYVELVAVERPHPLIPLLTFVFGRFSWDSVRRGVAFQASGPSGIIGYLITSTALAEFYHGRSSDLDGPQSLRAFSEFESRIHRIAQRERRPFEENQPLIVIRTEDVRGE